MKPDVATAVADAIRSVLRDTGRAAGPLEPAMRLAGDVGLDSLDLAQTIVLLERSLGVDPFRTAAHTTAITGRSTTSSPSASATSSPRFTTDA